MTETIKNCTTCGHSSIGNWESPELREKWRYCILCGAYCYEVNHPLYKDSDWNCKSGDQWVPRPPEPLTIWQQIGRAILTKLSSSTNS